jgi:hypothetical protein
MAFQAGPTFVTLCTMSTAGGPPPGGESSEIVAARAQALGAASDALGWRLTGERWETIQQVLAAMAVALETDDLDALKAATAELELVGPVRIVRIGAPPVVPPPPQVRDRLNRLVYTLGGTTAREADESELGSSSS